jgi:aminoglycoside 6'-N-acetyltransferase I
VTGEFSVSPLPQDDEVAAEQAAHLLVEGFRKHWPDAWPTVESARFEMFECLQPERIAFAARDPDGRLIGWVGGIPQYDGNVWELHPLVVAEGHRRRGVARALVEALEREAAARGGLTLWLGTDDESNLTSLGGVDVYHGILRRLAELRDVGGHPFPIYQKLGFELAGVLPDANGFGKPDILMAKRLRRADA